MHILENYGDRFKSGNPKRDDQDRFHSTEGYFVSWHDLNRPDKCSDPGSSYGISGCIRKQFSRTSRYLCNPLRSHTS